MISPEAEASLKKLRIGVDQVNGMPVVSIVHGQMSGKDALLCFFGPPLTQEVFNKALEALVTTGRGKGLKVKI
jgi:hypothetical protein